MEITGGCLCGAVQYKFEGTPTSVFLCHCRDCQRAGGSVVHWGVMLPKSGFGLKGELRSYESRNEAGRSVRREFCPICGSGLLNELELAPDQVVVRGGTLDDGAALKPTWEVYARSRPAWMPPCENTQCFEVTPTVPLTDLLRWSE